MGRFPFYYISSDGYRRPVKGFDNQTIWINPNTSLIEVKDGGITWNKIGEIGYLEFQQLDERYYSSGDITIWSYDFDKPSIILGLYFKGSIKSASSGYESALNLFLDGSNSIASVSTSGTIYISGEYNNIVGFGMYGMGYYGKSGVSYKVAFSEYVGFTLDDFGSGTLRASNGIYLVVSSRYGAYVKDIIIKGYYLKIPVQS